MKNILWIASFFVSLQLFASDAFHAHMDQKFGHFLTIDRALLEKAIIQTPSQATLWGCGLHQVGHALVCAGQECTIDFSKPGDYPLSVDANIGCIAAKIPFFSMFASQIPQDREGMFRVGPTPNDMCTYLGKKLSSAQCKPVVSSTAQLSQEQLDEIITTSIGHNMPTLAYYVVDANTGMMHVYAIVGHSDDEVLLLDTKGDYTTRLKSKNKADFIAALNAQAIIGLVKLVDGVGAIIGLRRLIVGEGGYVASQESVNAWNAYSLIGFSKEDLPTADMDLD